MTNVLAMALALPGILFYGIALLARAAHSQKKEHKFYDKKAIEIVKQLDYTFPKRRRMQP